MFTNADAKPKLIVLEADTTLYLGFRIASPPSESFVIRPFLISTIMDENAKGITDLKTDLSYINTAIEGKYNLYDTLRLRGTNAAVGHFNSPTSDK